MTRIDSKTNARGPKSKASRKKVSQAARDMFRYAYELKVKGNARENIYCKVKEPKKILVAQYESDCGEIIKFTLEIKGHNCTLTRDGVELVELARSLMPDLIITSVWLTKIDGLKAAELIRDDPKTCSIPILLASRSLSSVGFLEEKYSTLAEDFDYLLRKPFTSGELIAGVEILTS